MMNHYLLSKYGIKKGINMFGDHGVRAVRKELDQLQDRKVIQTRLSREINVEHKIRALFYLMFLKEKIFGSTYGSCCAYGRPQQLFMKKEDTKSPTVSIQGLMFSCMIGSKEDRNVETEDISGDFLQTDDTIGSTNFSFDGMVAELLARIDPGLYRKYITTYEKGRKIIYSGRLKALY